MKTFGRNVKIYRKNLHLSQKDVADRLNINTSNIPKIENGEQFVSAEVLYALADILQVSVSDLFRVETPPNTSVTDSAKEKLIKYSSTLTDEEASLVYEMVKLFRKYNK